MREMTVKVSQVEYRLLMEVRDFVGRRGTESLSLGDVPYDGTLGATVGLAATYVLRSVEGKL